MLAPFAAAQTASPISIRVVQGQTGATVAEGGTITLASETPRGAVNATIALTNTSSTTALTINRITFTGNLDFQVTGLADDQPFTLAAGQTMSIPVRFTPSSSDRVTGTINVLYTFNRVNGQFSLNLVGTSPEYAFSFIPRDGNASPVNSGGTITFPLTPIDATSNSTVVITNRGTAPVKFNSATVTGSAYQLAGVPLPGTLIEAGRDLRFNVNFTPRSLDATPGSLSVDVAGTALSFNLAGTASAPLFSHEIVEPTQRPLAPNGEIAMPDTPVNERSSTTVRVRNTGNSEGRITAIAVAGTGFSLTDTPFLPLTLQPGAAAQFRLHFVPPEPGRHTGRLRIGDNSFDVSGSGMGIALTYGYQVGETAVTVSSNGNVVFSPTAVGRSSELQFRINNTGTLPATINSIAVAGPDTFTLLDTPAFPAQLEPGASIPVRVQFAPTALGAQTATLRVDNATFTLTASGTNPTALPEYRLEGPTGVQQPRQQPTVRLMLASPYTLPLNGTLTLTFASEVFADDPAVQFAAGGRTIAFRIPAGTTQAVFPDGSNQARLQTGTVAGTITLIPSFVTEGGINLTPQNPAVVRLSVAQAAPVVLNASITTRTATGFTLLVSGYATSRSVTRMNISFTARSGEVLDTSSLTLNVESAFLAWFQSSQSVPFGSLFSISVPLTLTGDIRGENLSLSDTITAVAVTLTNAAGTSNSVTADVR